MKKGFYYCPVCENEIEVEGFDFMCACGNYIIIDDIADEIEDGE